MPSYSGQDVMDHWIKCHGEQEEVRDNERFVLRHLTWELKHINILGETEYKSQRIDRKDSKIIEYCALNVEEMPPIIVVPYFGQRDNPSFKYTIVDGWHRCHCMVLRGVPSILSYVPS